MQSAPKDILKGYVQSQQFSSTADIMQAMKKMFRDVLEQVMEVEMDDELGRERWRGKFLAPDVILGLAADHEALARPMPELGPGTQPTGADVPSSGRRLSSGEFPRR